MELLAVNTDLVVAVLSVAAAALALWKAHLERKGKLAEAELADAALHGIEAASAELQTRRVKEAVGDEAAKRGVHDLLNRKLDAKGWRSERAPKP